MKKAPTRAEGLRTCGFPLAGNPPKALRFRRLQGLFHSALSGSRGSVAGSKPASSGSVEPNEAPLAGLENCTSQPVARYVQLAHGVAVELDAALRDQPPRLAGREAEGLGEERRQMDEIA